MPTVPELLRHEVRPGEEATIVLRSGYEISGPVEEVDLATYVIRLGGWAVRVDEIAGVRVAAPVPRAA